MTDEQALAWVDEQLAAGFDLSVHRRPSGDLVAMLYRQGDRSRRSWVACGLGLDLRRALVDLRSDFELPL